MYRINGMEDHIHILCDLNPTIALADLIRDLKTTTSIWMKKSDKFPSFRGWSDGYAAMTYSWRDKDRIVEYIRGQQEHHKKRSFEEELRTLLTEQGIEIDMKYFP